LQRSHAHDRWNIAHPIAVSTGVTSRSAHVLSTRPRRLEMKMTASLAIFVGAATSLVGDPRPSEALVNAAQLYPYCQISSSNGGMSCYLSSRDQCEFREVCIRNPHYLGVEGARAWKRKNKPEWGWW
jgi:hypothetical protein